MCTRVCVYTSDRACLSGHALFCLRADVCVLHRSTHKYAKNALVVGRQRHHQCPALMVIHHRRHNALARRHIEFDANLFKLRGVQLNG